MNLLSETFTELLLLFAALSFVFAFNVNLLFDIFDEAPPLLQAAFGLRFKHQVTSIVDRSIAVRAPTVAATTVASAGNTIIVNPTPITPVFGTPSIVTPSGGSPTTSPTPAGCSAGAVSFNGTLLPKFHFKTRIKNKKLTRANRSMLSLTADLQWRSSLHKRLSSTQYEPLVPDHHIYKSNTKHNLHSFHLTITGPTKHLSSTRNNNQIFFPLKYGILISQLSFCRFRSISYHQHPSLGISHFHLSLLSSKSSFFGIELSYPVLKVPHTLNHTASLHITRSNFPH
jgi:hypothetical protein